MSKWKSHPWLARLLRFAIFVTPLGGAFGFTWVAGRVLPPERVGINRWVWILLVFVLANILMVVLRRSSQRLVPLVALMKLTLVFPDHAPSRTKATLRKSNSRTMLRNMEAARARGEERDEVVHGEYIVQLLKEVNEHDRLTRGHSERVRAYAEMIGEELRLSDDDMNKLRWSALLHDVGKLTVPSEVLNKDGRPTEDEWRVLSGHPAAGGVMLEPLRDWLGDWVHSADQHHCRWDGTGYPEKLGGLDIALSGRLVAVADAYDVMTSARSYKKPLDPELARHELTDCAGSQFDPTIVRAFLNVSLGRLRTVPGPFAWLMNATGTSTVPVPSAAATWSVASSAVGLITVGSSTIGAPASVPEEPLAFDSPQSVVAGDLEVWTVEGGEIVIRLEAEGGNGSIEFVVEQAETGSVEMRSEADRIDDESQPNRSRWVADASYRPQQFFTGQDGFDYRACDEFDACADGHVTVNVDEVPSTTTTEPTTTTTESTTTTTEPSTTTTTDRPTTTSTAAPTTTTTVPPTTTTTVAPATTTTTVAPTTTTAPPANRAPVAADDAATTNEDNSVLIDALVNDSDPDGDSTAFSAMGSPAQGSVAIESNRIRYTPNPDFAGTDSFTYSIADGSLVSNVATVTITVSPVNDAPVAGNDGGVGYTTAEDTAFTTADVTANDSDVDNPVDASTITVVSGVSDGALIVNGDGTFGYTPDPDFSGMDSFTYTINDTVAASNVATVTITVSPVNDAPVAVDDGGVGYATVEDTAFTTADVTANDSDVDNPVDASTITVVSGVSDGALIVNGDGTFGYTPDPDFFGSDSFTYSFADGSQTSNVATVTITVSPVNDAPVAANDTGAGFNAVEDTSFTTADVTANDSDVDDAVDPSSVTVVSTASNGVLVDNGDGTFGYTPDLNFSGNDSFTYSIADGSLGSNVASVVISVSAVNDAPVAGDDGGVGYATAEDTAFTTADVTANDSDVDNPVDASTITVVSGVSDGALIVNGDGTFGYTPDADFSGTDSFTYTINDTVAASNVATVTIAVSPLNDAPVAADDSGAGFTTSKNLGFTTGDVTANDSDVDDAVDATSITVVSGVSDGLLSDNGDGTFDYTPDLNFTGTDSFTYTIADGSLTSNTATVTISVSASAGLVISEYSNVGDSLLSNDFIELYNASPSAIDIEGWTLEVANDSSITQTIILTGPNTLMPPGGHYLLATGSGQDQSLSGSLTDSFSARIRNGATIVDTVGTRERNRSPILAAGLWSEGTGLPPLIDTPPYTPSWERRSAGTYGNCIDTDDNSADFTRNFTSTQVNPQSSASPDTPCGTPVAPAPPNHLVISEYRTDGPAGGEDEYLELFNPTAGPLSMNGMSLQTTLGATIFNLPDVTLAPGQHYLVGGSAYAGQADASTVGGFKNSDGAQLFDSFTSTVVDDIGIGAAEPFLPPLEGRLIQSYERRFGGCQDTAAPSSWLDDFVHQSSPAPRVFSDPPITCS